MFAFLKNLFAFLNNSMDCSIEDKKEKIQSIINVFETGSIKGDYANVSIFADGPSNRRQITYGRSQTTEWGNLRDLIKDYVNAKGQYYEFFIPYIKKIGSTSLVNDSTFISYLKKAGKDPIMLKTQDAFFDKHYWEPALKFLKDNELVLPLSALVVYDSYIHSGGILSFLRKRFAATPPAKGGNEKEWIRQYLKTRHSWLATHSRRILRKTIYRTRDMQRAIDNNDWNLEKPFVANSVKVD